MSLQPLDGPSEGGGGRFVTCCEHRDQLVGDLLASHRRAVLVPALQHQGQHIVTGIARLEHLPLDAVGLAQNRRGELVG